MNTPVAHMPFSLHALIAEAKRRARQRRLVITALLLAVAATAAGLAIGLSSGNSRSATQAGLSTKRAAPHTGPAAASSGTPDQQGVLDAAVYDAQRITGTYYTGAVVRDSSTTVLLYLAHAPQPVIARLRKTQPGIYSIRNDAPRSLIAVMKLMHSTAVDAALKADGITVAGKAPTQDGHLRVGVTDRVAEAQATVDAKFGVGVIRVFKQGRASLI